jgi:hypothetical protein
METSSFPFLDPVLARKTRPWHLALFTIATLLVLPAGYVFVVVIMLTLDGGFGHISRNDGAMIFSAAIPSATGILAWAALGMLMMKPAHPRWHLVCWPFVMLFGISAVPGCIYWMVEVLSPHFSGLGLNNLFGWIVMTALAAALVSMAVGLRNFLLARRSLAAA